MRKIIRFYDNDGFTIIELLMAILILGVVMAAITTMIVQSFNVFDSSTRRMSAGQLAELALSEVGEYLRSATNIIELNKENGSWKFDGYHPNYEEKVKFNFSKTGEQLLLSISSESDNDIDIDRVVVNNVQDFYIEKDEGSENEFIIYIEVEDGDENLARKRISISSRNL